jgi:hypothetical protein
VDLTRTRIRGPASGSAVSDSASVDVVQALGASVLLFRGGTDLYARAEGDWEIHRYRAGDAFNLNATLGVRVHP